MEIKQDGKYVYFERLQILEMSEIDRIIRKTKNKELRVELIRFLKHVRRLYLDYKNDVESIRDRLLGASTKIKEDIDKDIDSSTDVKILENLNKLEETERMIALKEKQLEEIKAELHYLSVIIMNNDPENIIY